MGRFKVSIKLVVGECQGEKILNDIHDSGGVPHHHRGHQVAVEPAIRVSVRALELNHDAHLAAERVTRTRPGLADPNNVDGDICTFLVTDRKSHLSTNRSGMGQELKVSDRSSSCRKAC